MKVMRLLTVLFSILTVMFLGTIAGASTTAAPDAGPCAPGTAYDPACDVDHNGQINVTDIQLAAGHWGQTGTFTSDNDHDHLGQTWTGARVPLKIESNFDGTGGSLPAALVLGNTRTSGAGYGLWVTSVSGNGVHVNAAGADGVYVCTTGAASGCTASGENNGLEVGNAEDNGVLVKTAGNDGMVVSWADDDGVYVNSAGDDGLRVGLVQNGDGLQVDNAPSSQGVRVVSAWGGFFVDSATSRGLTVVSVGSPSSTSHDNFLGNGVDIEGAERYGVRIGHADNDGIHVASSGDHGLYVGTTTDAGLYVNAAGTDGVYVNSAGGAGVKVNSAVGNGVDGRTNTLASYGGQFSNGAGGGAALYAIGGGNDAADLILGGTTTTSGDDGRIYSQPDSTSSDILLFSMDNLHIHLDNDNNSTSASAFVIYNGGNTPVWSVSESGLAVAGEGAAAVVDAGEEGQQLVYAIHSPQNWLEDFGSGRLVAGEAVVSLDSAFAKVASVDAAYHVFLTPLGDCPLYVAEKGAATFTVRALGGQTCAVSFDYRVVALRQGYESNRMPEFVVPEDD
ncbi:MAG: hypothetical protein KDI55_12220 [Anaerolineae bacterium]|nr:hypothetical protein [Anaerolineae bacterium]